MPRGLTFSVNVISLGTDSSGRQTLWPDLFGLRLPDRPSDRLVEMDVAMSRGALPDGQDASSAVELCIGFTTSKINQAYILK